MGEQARRSNYAWRARVFTFANKNWYPESLRDGITLSHGRVALFLEHVYRWIKPGGVLILVVPGPRLQVCDKLLAVQFKDKKAYRLSHPESVKYKQVVLFGVRRTRREREQMKDRDVERARVRLADMSRKWEQLPSLSDAPGIVYAVPEGVPVQLEHRG